MFLTFICANNIGSLVNSLLRVKIFNPFFYFSSSTSSGSMSDESTDSSLQSILDFQSTGYIYIFFKIN